MLDPALAPVILGSDFSDLLRATRMYIVGLEAANATPTASSVTSNQLETAQPQTSNGQPVGLRKFAFLSAKLNAVREVAITTGSPDTVATQLNRYLATVGQDGESASTALEY